MTLLPTRESGLLARRTVRRLMVLSIMIGGVCWYGSVRQQVDLSQPIAVVPPSRLSSPAGNSLKVGVFNIHGCKGMDGERDVARVASNIHDLDLVALHEVRAGYTTNQAYELGRLSDLSAVFAPTEWRWWRNDFGNGLLTNLELRSLHQIPLAVTSHTYRNALLTSFQFAGETVQLMIVHVDLMQDRERQLDEVSELFLSLRSPAILMGDLNAEARHPGIRKLLAEPGVINALAETKDNGRDWIITKGLSAVSVKVHRTHASDHPLIEAELVLADDNQSSDSPDSVKQAANDRNEH